jgi:hypothetical protein
VAKVSQDEDIIRSSIIAKPSIMVVHRYRGYSSHYLPNFLSLLLLVLSSSTRFDLFLLVHGLVFFSKLFGSILFLVDRHGIRGF